MLAVSKLAVKSVSGSLFSRSYGKIRELTSTVPNKMPKVCSPEEVVGVVNSGDKVSARIDGHPVGVGSSRSLLSSRPSERSVRRISLHISFDPIDCEGSWTEERRNDPSADVG